MPVIEKNFPEKIKDFEFAINHPEEYYENIKKEVELLSKKYNLNVKDVITDAHSTFMKGDEKDTEQELQLEDIMKKNKFQLRFLRSL